MEQEQNYWSDAQGSEEGVGEVFENLPDATTSIYVNGAYIDVSPGDPFGTSVLQAARDADLGKFRVFDGMSGREIMPDHPDTPEHFTEGMKIELRPYDEAA